MFGNEKDNTKHIAIVGGLALAACLIFRHRGKENEQRLLEERSKAMETRRIKSLRRQEFLHNIIYKIFGM